MANPYYDPGVVVASSNLHPGKWETGAGKLTQEGAIIVSDDTGINYAYDPLFLMEGTHFLRTGGAWMLLLMAGVLRGSALLDSLTPEQLKLLGR